MTRAAQLLLLVVTMPIGLWLSVTFLTPTMDAYLALVRSGLLLMGLAALAWGILWQRVRMVWVGIGALGLGFSTFLYDRAFDNELRWKSEALARSFSKRIHIGPSVELEVWHVMIASLVILNGILLARHVRAQGIVGANMVLLAAMFVLIVAVGGRP